MRLVELKTQALRYVVLGDAARAFRCYRQIVAALPSDLDARMKIADLCVTTRLHDLARRIYAAVAFYDLQSGRPLHALVASQALRSLQPTLAPGQGPSGEEVGALNGSLAELYGQGSPRVGHGGGDRVGARLAPPDPDAEIAPFDLATDGDAASEARAAAELAADTTSLQSFPELFPPVPLLSDLSPPAFARVLDTVRVARLSHGAKVIKEGEPGDSFYLIAAGHVRVYSTDSLGRQHDLAKLGEGAIFGELALVAAQPRGATVEVVGEADLLEVGAAALRAAASELEQLAEALGRFTRDRLLKNLLATSPLFKPFSTQQRLDLARRFTGHDVAPGTDLIREGDAGRGLYVVLAGEMEVVKGEEPFETTLATLRGGDLFGEIALLRGTPATATVRAARPSTVLFLAREYFERLIAALPEMRAFFEQLTEERLRAADAALNDETVLGDEDLVLI